MNIEQMLRDAIERKTAKILKEEYGIEMSKQMTDAILKKCDEPNEQCQYQTVLMDVGENDDRIADIINNFTHNKMRTNALIDATPVVIHRGFTVDGEVAIRNELLNNGADAFVEKTIKVYQSWNRI